MMLIFIVFATVKQFPSHAVSKPVVMPLLMWHFHMGHIFGLFAFLHNGRLKVGKR